MFHVYLWLAYCHINPHYLLAYCCSHSSSRGVGARRTDNGKLADIGLAWSEYWVMWLSYTQHNYGNIVMETLQKMLIHIFYVSYLDLVWKTEI